MATSSSFTNPKTVNGEDTDVASDSMDNGEDPMDNTLQELPFYNEDNFTDVILVVDGRQLFKK